MNFTLIALLQSAVIETVSVLLPMKFVLPNGPQAELLTGIEVCDLASAQNAARVLCSKGCEAVIITLGEKGSVLVFHNITQFGDYRVGLGGVKTLNPVKRNNLQTTYTLLLPSQVSLTLCEKRPFRKAQEPFAAKRFFNIFLKFFFSDIIYNSNMHTHTSLPAN